MSLPALETCASVVSAYECVTEGNKKKKLKKGGVVLLVTAQLYSFFPTQQYGMLAVRFIQEIPRVIHSASQCVCTVTAVPGEPTGADNRAADMKKPLTRPLFTLCLISPLSHFLCSQACAPALIF